MYSDTAEPFISSVLLVETATVVETAAITVFMLLIIKNTTL